MNPDSEEPFNTIVPTTRTTGSYNYLSPTSFQVVIPKLPKLTYFVQSISLPSIMMGSIEIPAYKGLPKQETPSYLDISDDLIVNFVIDENMESWQELYDWMTEIVPSPENDGNVNYKKDLFSSIVVSVYNNAKIAKKRFTFHNCYPLSLSSFEFNSTVTETDPMVISASFEYSNFTVESI